MPDIIALSTLACTEHGIAPMYAVTNLVEPGRLLTLYHKIQGEGQWQPGQSLPS